MSYSQVLSSATRGTTTVVLGNKDTGTVRIQCSGLCTGTTQDEIASFVKDAKEVKITASLKISGLLSVQTKDLVIDRTKLVQSISPKLLSGPDSK